MANLQDKRILLNMLQDNESFEIFYKHFYNKIYAFLLSRTKDSNIAKELVNETFFKIYMNKSKIDPENNYLSYFFSIANNEFRQKIRRKNLEVPMENGILDTIGNSFKTSDFEYLDDESMILKVENAMKDFSREEHIIINKRFYEDKSIKTIAVELGLKEGTIKSKISRAIKKIREKI